MFVQLLVMAARSRWLFTTVTLTLGAAIVFMTPRVWSIEWTGVLPLWAASYLTEATGSQFPLFPWAGYILLGISLGQIYSRWGAAQLTVYANTALLVPGALLIAGGLALRPLAAALFASGPTSFVPPEVLIRAGTCMLILGAIAYPAGTSTGYRTSSGQWRRRRSSSTSSICASSMGRSGTPGSPSFMGRR